jgi:hypothetical protein
MNIVLFLVLLIVGLALALAAIVAVIGSILWSWRHSAHVPDELRKAGL